MATFIEFEDKYKTIVMIDIKAIVGFKQIAYDGPTQVTTFEIKTTGGSYQVCGDFKAIMRKVKGY